MVWDKDPHNELQLTLNINMNLMFNGMPLSFI